MSANALESPVAEAPPAALTPLGLKAELVRRAQELGFDDCRIASANPPAHAGEFRQWLREGAAGEMEWLHRGEEKRCAPTRVLPSAQSLIVVAMNYWQGHVTTPASNRGRIARYAWGDDYHDVMREEVARARRLSHAATAGAEDATSTPARCWNATSRREAGIGWHGKSTMLHPSASSGPGSSSRRFSPRSTLPPDAPQPTRCGSCTRCIDACPTGAITAPHQLDARRCISYLTIELKGSIPLEFRPLIGDRIYGCDDCLDACPWNRFAQRRARERVCRAPGSSTRMQLRDFLALDDDAIPRALPRLTDQADQAPRLPAQRLRRARQCRNPRRFAGAGAGGAGSGTADRRARGVGDREIGKRRGL